MVRHGDYSDHPIDHSSPLSAAGIAQMEIAATTISRTYPDFVEGDVAVIASATPRALQSARVLIVALGMTTEPEPSSPLYVIGNRPASMPHNDLGKFIRTVIGGHKERSIILVSHAPLVASVALGFQVRYPYSPPTVAPYGHVVPVDVAAWQH